jgi:predicted O-methyltransferase YrrM
VTRSRLTTAMVVFLLAAGGFGLVLSDSPLLLAGSAVAIAAGFVLQTRRVLLATQDLARRVDRHARKANRAIDAISADLGRMRVETESRFGALEGDLTRRSTAQTQAILEEVAQVEIDIRGAVRAFVADLQSALEGLPEEAGRITREAFEKERNRMVAEIDGLVAIYTTLSFDVPLPPFGGWAMTAASMRRIVTEVLERRPLVVLEAGSGVSTVVLAKALQSSKGGGRLISLEHDPTWAERTRRQLVLHEVENVVELVVRPLVPQTAAGATLSWYDLAGVDLSTPVEVVLIDGPPKASGPNARFPALPLLVDALSSNAVVFVDDAGRAEEREAIKRWTTDLPGWAATFPADTPGLAEVRRS